MLCLQMNAADRTTSSDFFDVTINVWVRHIIGHVTHFITIKNLIQLMQRRAQRNYPLHGNVIL